jgi:hypothetical protein
VMDMIYHLPFRDWMELDKRGQGASVLETEPEVGSGDSAPGRKRAGRS